MGAAADSSSFVRSIYDAAVSERAWQDLPRILARDLEGESSVIWYADASTPAALAAFNQSDQSLRAYGEYFRFIDPWSAKVMRHGLVSVAFRGDELVEDQKLVQSEFYYDFLRKADVLPNIGAHLSLGAGVIGAVGIHRPLTRSPFKDDLKELLQSLVGHLEQMLTLRRHLRTQEISADLSLGALNKLSAGMVICDAQTNIIFANAAAEALCPKHGVIALAAGAKLAVADRPSGLRLRAMIADAAQGKAGGAVCVSDELGDRLLVVVSPLPGMLDDAPGRALVTMRSERSALGAEPELLMGLFELTAAEADLACGLMQNHSLLEIRARRCVTENTIRTQLAHVFAKTGTANQRELVRLLSLVPATLEGPSPE